MEFNKLPNIVLINLTETSSLIDKALKDKNG